jgi:hypothetical protein
MINLDLNHLTVESFPTADDPAQALRLPWTATDEEETPCCENNVYGGISLDRTCGEEG